MSGKRIADPIHQTIPLSAQEAAVISTPAFQRMRFVKQLGLADFVFPGANYSRFAHSVGTCHVMGLALDGLKQGGVDVSEDEIRQHRLAALLHDIGHYPFSHAMELAVMQYQALKMTVDPEKGPAQEFSHRQFSHEALTQEIIKRNPAVRDALGADAEAVAAICSRASGRFMNLVSSDLDADRIDYLLRTARSTGLPYGNVDLPYLASQLRLDSNDDVCLDVRALRTAEHLLLARLFDYRQVTHHKTVVAFEEMLKDVIRSLLDEGSLPAQADGFTKMISDGGWEDFDDSTVWHAIRSRAKANPDDPTTQKAVALLRRRAPSLICGAEYFEPGDQATMREFDEYLKRTLELVKRVAEAHHIPEPYWYVWPYRMRITKLGAEVPTSEAGRITADELAQGVRILDPGSDASTPLNDRLDSIVHVLSNATLYSVRVYALIPDERRNDLAEICAMVVADFPWVKGRFTGRHDSREAETQAS